MALLLLGGHTASVNYQRHNNKISIKCKNSGTIMTIITPYRNQVWQHITQMLTWESKDMSGSSHMHNYASKNTVYTTKMS